MNWKQPINCNWLNEEDYKELEKTLDNSYLIALSRSTGLDSEKAIKEKFRVEFIKALIIKLIYLTVPLQSD